MRLTRIAPVVVLLSLSACMSWHRHDLPADGAPVAVAWEHPLRVTRADRSTLVLEHAQVVGDSLVGSMGEPEQRTAVALRDITQVEERKVSFLRTTGAVAGGVVVMSAVLVVAAFLALLGSYQ